MGGRERDEFTINLMMDRCAIFSTWERPSGRSLVWVFVMFFFSRPHHPSHILASSAALTASGPPKRCSFDSGLFWVGEDRH